MDSDELRVTVAANGIGLRDVLRRGGLGNNAERAAALGGRLELSAGETDRGTTLVWRVPLPSDS